MENSTVKDIFIIGGGINGVGIARDAAGRGLSVVLCEQHDLASGTSSASSKLIHGGLRYLEHYEFSLVSKALKERKILLRAAPHLLRPQQFIIPLDNLSRPVWLIRLGLWIYDLFAGKHNLPKSQYVDITTDALRHSTSNKGFSYYDAYADDARLVITNAIDAHQRGAKIISQMTVVNATAKTNHWEIETRDHQQQTHRFQAKVLINAAGPWVDKIAIQHPQKPSQSLRLVKGSHIVTRRLYSGDQAYLLQNTDKRIVFVIPFQQHYSLIGTTEHSYESDLQNIQISTNEIAYLLASVNRYLKTALTTADIIWNYAGVRPLLPSLSRDYEIQVTSHLQQPTLVTIYGGKITTYRRLAEATLDALQTFFPALKPAWTAQAILPGGDLPQQSLSTFINSLAQQYPWCSPQLLMRYAEQYGSRSHMILNHKDHPQDFSKAIAGDLFPQEVDYLIQYEWARTIEDILWRRTKLGLHFSKSQTEKLATYLKKHLFLQQH